MAVLALAGLALAIICLSQRPLLSFLVLPTAGLTGIWTRTQAALSAWRARRAKAAPDEVSTAAPPVAVAPESETASAATAPTEAAAASVIPPGSPTKAAKGGRYTRSQQAFPFAAGTQGYTHPSLKFLDAPPAERGGSTQEEMAQNSQIL